MKKLPWRVRVVVKQEAWVDVVAASWAAAELEAATLPNVVSVFGKSAVLANKEAGAELAAGVREELY